VTSPRADAGQGRPDALGWKTSLAVTLGIAVFRLLRATWRIRVEPNAEYAALRAKRGTPEGAYLIAFWHGEMLGGLAYHAPHGYAVMVSSHRDGEIIARILAAIGSSSIRGSSSRGGREALVGMIRHLRAGGRGAITPDGPRGPRHSFAPGTLVAAARTGSPIVVLRVHADRAWRLNSWDRFMIPKPFARVTIAHGGPTRVVLGPDGHVPPEEIARIEALMAETGRRIGADS
jgi:lysophospholipid acyltransferase (LPLAT)-like uncharacterized protein